MPRLPHYECRPLGTLEVAAYMTKKGVPTQEDTVRKWKQRGVLDDPDFTIGGRPVWTIGTIENWMKRTNRTAKDYQKRKARWEKRHPEPKPTPQLEPETLTCDKCGRIVEPWPLARGARCSPENWQRCIRNDGDYAFSVVEPLEDDVV